MQHFGSQGRTAIRMAGILGAMLAVGACGSTPTSPDDSAPAGSGASFYIQNNTLIVPGAGQNARRGRITLYRVRETPQRYRTSDVQVMRKRFLRRPDFLTFHIDRQPTATGKFDPQRRRISFKLPATLGEPDACYIMVQGGRPQPIEQTLGTILQNYSETDYLLGFKPYALQQKREANLSKLKKRLATEEANARQVRTRIQSANRRLATSRNFRRGHCKWIPPVLPARPHNYMAAREANRIASGHYFNFLKQKYACSAAVVVARAMGEKNEHMRRAARIGNVVCTTDAFTSAFGFPLIKNKYARFIPRNEWSTAVDIWEAFLANCAQKGDRGCQAAFAATLVIRAASAISDMERQLLAPTRRWHAATQRAKSNARQSHAQCNSDRALIANRVNATRQADQKVSMAKRDVGLENQYVADYHRDIFRAVDLRCSRALSEKPISLQQAAALVAG